MNTDFKFRIVHLCLCVALASNGNFHYDIFEKPWCSEQGFVGVSAFGLCMFGYMAKMCIYTQLPYSD